MYFMTVKAMAGDDFKVIYFYILRQGVGGGVYMCVKLTPS